jgi:hypothetical protein
VAGTVETIVHLFNENANLITIKMAVFIKSKSALSSAFADLSTYTIQLSRGSYLVPLIVRAHAGLFQ